MRPRQPSWEGSFTAAGKHLFPPPLSGGKEEAENKRIQELRPGNQHRGNHMSTGSERTGIMGQSGRIGQEGGREQLTG